MTGILVLSRSNSWDPQTTRKSEDQQMVIFALALINFAAIVGDDAAAGVVGIILLLLLGLIGLVLYFLPTLIAISRNHHQWGAIAVINLFFGWTFIGWVVSLAWSVTAARER